MRFINIYLHVIWSTKNRSKIIAKGLKLILIQHIKSNAKEKEIFIDSINCTDDHIHLLISLGTDQTISKIVQLIKGESSQWVNKSQVIKGKFGWQDDYIALSVSKSILDKVRKHIDNQEEHHRIKSFLEELDEFKKKYGFENLN
ncbi:MAG: IS200/IS605 family transposase [Ignavibacteriota bacterium]|nr:IS200/IS605 family transposase [Ignavibacteriota bacterium]QKJ97009.1 MAG: IS200/IS605 family transposase [Ignavibacteriota bacterium]GIK60717.1 MAG: transposase [Ignavibacteriota bacterium]